MQNNKNCRNENAFFGFDFDQLGKTIEDFIGKSNVNEFFGRDFAHKTPLVNVYESAEHGLEIEIAAPGLSRDAFSVTIEGEELQVSANLNINKVAENVKVKRKEFDYSTFKRNFRLHDKFDSENITARYENGILLIRVPLKTETKKESFKVNIL
jgi:HSP20 family protein